MKYEYVLGVDPGDKITGYALIHSDGTPIQYGIEENEKLRERTIPNIASHFSIDGVMVMEYMEVRGREYFGKECRRALWWAGRFRDAWPPTSYYYEVWPRWVHRAMCGTQSVDAATLRRAILERYPPSGGGKEPVIGIKSDKGPLYGIKSHAISALGVALTFLDHTQQIIKDQEVLG